MKHTHITQLSIEERFHIVWTFHKTQKRRKLTRQHRRTSLYDSLWLDYLWERTQESAQVASLPQGQFELAEVGMKNSRDNISEYLLLHWHF